MEWEFGPCSRMGECGGGGALLLLYVYWVGEQILERQLIGAAFHGLKHCRFMAVGGGLLTVFFNLLWGPIGAVVAPLFAVSFLAAAGWCFLRAGGAMA